MRSEQNKATQLKPGKSDLDTLSTDTGFSSAPAETSTAVSLADSQDGGMAWWQDVEVEADVTVLEMVLASDSGPAKAVRDYEAAMISQESERLTKAIANMDALQGWTVRAHPQAESWRVG